MKKLLLLDKNNKILVSMDQTCPETGDDIIVDKSVEFSANIEGMVVKLKEDYNTSGNAYVEIEDGEIIYKFED